MKHRSLITVIRKSCLTGKVVWIYSGPSEESARLAYWRACKKEVERVMQWDEVAGRRMSNVARMLSDCMAGIPINAELTPRQAEAARQLKAFEKKGIACHREFYDHIMEERRRRENDREIRRRMRARDNEHNMNYDK